MFGLRPYSAPQTALEIANGFINIANQQTIEDPKTGEQISEGITHLKLQKLLYFAQAAHLALFDTELFSDEILAWKYGPVVPSVYKEFAAHKAELIPFVETTHSTPPDVEQFLKEVWKLFGKYSATELVNLSHQHTPWKECDQGAVIEKAVIRDFYKTVFVFKQDDSPDQERSAT